MPKKIIGWRIVEKNKREGIHYVVGVLTQPTQPTAAQINAFHSEHPPHAADHDHGHCVRSVERFEHIQED